MMPHKHEFISGKEPEPIVLILTGPCGVGKTTIANLIAQNNHFIHIFGDNIQSELYPGIENIAAYPGALEKIYKEILQKAKKLFKEGKNVVIDYIIVDQKTIEEYKEAFSGNLLIKVLLSKKEVIAERDGTRIDWRAGEKFIGELCDLFAGIKDYIGTDNYIDTSLETPEETYSKHFAKINFAR
jgi:adenylylsulfate kinase-like enzyme